MELKWNAKLMKTKQNVLALIQDASAKESVVNVLLTT